MSYWSRIVNVFRGDRLAREIDEEMEAHLMDAMEEGRDGREAERAFGSRLRHREEIRDVRLATRIDSFRADVVFGWRQLWKNKTTTLVAILSLGLAMGACLAVFRLIDAMLLRPLPIRNASSLFVLAYPYTDAAGKTDMTEWFDYPQFRILRASVKDEAEFIAISEPSSHGLTFSSDDQTERFFQQSVSGWMFDSFGLKPALGRLLKASDDVKPGAHPVAVLSYDYWTRRFGRDPNVVGRKFRMGTELYEIVGVCQKGFTGTDPGTVTDLFVPTMMNAKAIDRPDWGWFRIWVQFKPGVKSELIAQKLRAAVHAVRQERVKDWLPGSSSQEIAAYTRAVLSFEPAAAGVSGLQKDYRGSLTALGVLVLLVLLIACANVANLMAARAAARSREMALRVSIGAGKWRLMQLVMIESALIAFLAYVIGVLFALWSTPFIVSRISPSGNPARLALDADWRVLVFAAVLVSAVTLLFGALPALRASSVKPMTTLRGGEEPHLRRRLMGALVGIQVAFCFLLYFIGGLFVATSDRLSHQPTGFVADRLLTVSTVTRNNEPSHHWDDVRQHLQSLPGIKSVAICGWALMSGNGWSDAIWVNGRPPANEEAYFLAVSTGWLQTMKIPLLGGRDLRPQDTYPGNVIVNEAFARRYFAGRNPLEQTFETVVNKKLVRSEIIGYVSNARYRDMRESIRPTAYVMFSDKVTPVDWATFVIRTARSDPMALAPTVRREVTRARSEFRVVEFQTQTELVEQHTVRERLLATLSLFFMTTAIVLALVGLYGVLSYSVLQRRREIAIRIALGAPSGEIAWRVTANTFLIITAGTAAGLMAGLASQRYLETMLYQVKATDPVMLGLPVGLTFSVAIFAALPPIIRAIRNDPALMLRTE
ncbi:MAG: ABC transporter permease [Acidobacteriota bacterium]|nr:ABC transporter permease [Acidobacteriota bacterium]